MQTGKPRRIMSGMRPTGRLHLGHLVGALTQWVEFSKTDETFFEVADLHALTTAYEHTEVIAPSVRDNVLDWLAAGVDPDRSTIYVQSHVPQIAELHLLLSMVVPVAWLQRVPTFKDQIVALGGEIATYGFLGYPLMQVCDIAIVRGDTVPVGKDQMSHLEFGREVVRRFNNLYGPVLVEAQGTLSEFPDVPGTDGRKMSKSYGNTIDMADDEATTTKRVRSMITDPLKVRRNDPGRPEICPVFKLHNIVNVPRVPAIEAECRTGELGCVACKSECAASLEHFLKPVRERRAALDPQMVDAILEAGAEKARAVAGGNDRKREVGDAPAVAMPRTDVEREDRSLITLLSQVLVAFTIELDNEWEVRLLANGRRRVVLVSFAMWANFLRFVRPGSMPVRELMARSGSSEAAIRSRFNAFGRWRYIDVEPDPMDDRAKPPLRDWNVRLTRFGEAAVELWPPLPLLVEQRWRERFGERRIATLFEALTSIAAHLDTVVPIYLPLATNLYAGVRSGDDDDVIADGDEPNAPADLVQALSIVLTALSRDVERESKLPLVLVANVLRVLTTEGVPVRDLPRRTGVSKEAVAMSFKPLEQREWIAIEQHPTQARTKIAKLTAKGRRIRSVYPDELAALEQRWIARVGTTTIETVRDVLEGLLDAKDGDASLMGSGLATQPVNWRARPPYLAQTKAMMHDPRAALPHYPMPLHRGGWPDGS